MVTERMRMERGRWRETGRKITHIQQGERHRDTHTETGKQRERHRERHTQKHRHTHNRGGRERHRGSKRLNKDGGRRHKGKTHSQRVGERQSNINTDTQGERDWNRESRLIQRERDNEREKVREPETEHLPWHWVFFQFFPRPS